MLQEKHTYSTHTYIYTVYVCKTLDSQYEASVQSGLWEVAHWRKFRGQRLPSGASGVAAEPWTDWT